MSEMNDDITYHEWLARLQSNPVSGGVLGLGLVGSTLTVMFPAVLFGLTLFPEGNYPRIVLALPGLLAGLAYLYVAGALFYRLPKILAVLLSLVIMVASLALGALLAMPLLT